VGGDFGGLLRIAGTEAEMEAAIEECLKGAGKVDESRDAARQDFLAKNTWAIRAEEALAAAEKLGRNEMR